MMDTTDNRRDAFRLRDDVSLSVFRLDENSLESALENFEKKRADFGLLSHLRFDVEKYMPQMRIIERNYPDIAGYLKFLERQIEFLTAHVSGCDDSSVSDRTEVELSAGGLQFTVDESCSVGDFFETAIILYPDETRLLAILKVTRVEIIPDGHHIISGEFYRIHDADREALVKHIHRLQIEDLRRGDS